MSRLLEDNEDNTVNCNCSYFDNDDYKNIGLAQIASGSVSLLGCAFMLFLILFLGKYKYSTQRILLYLNVAVALNSISFIIRGATYAEMDITPICQGVAYFGTMSGMCVLAAITCIIAEIFFKAVLEVGKRRHRYELIYPLLIFALPIMLSGIPFIKEKYGKSGPWCWIKGKDRSDEYICTDDKNVTYSCKTDTLGVAYQYGLWFGPVFLITIIGGIVYLISLINIQKKLKWHKMMYSTNTQKKEQRGLLEEVNHFRWYPTIFFLVNIMPLATRIADIYSNKNSNDRDNALIIMWLITACVEASQGLLLAIMFTLIPSTSRYLTCRRLKFMCRIRCGVCCSCCSCCNIEGGRAPLIKSQEVHIDERESERGKFNQEVTESNFIERVRE
uniref:G-protein coupled receptors family 2 profile 2 domain-containing protein n=1 Tax=Amphimedon queenslandica TaxID=400682 RepID=A0A1X7UQ95_AMPQE